MRKISLGILFVGLAFLGFGLFRSEFLTVFQKASSICLECIGIG